MVSYRQHNARLTGVFISVAMCLLDCAQVCAQSSMQPNPAAAPAALMDGREVRGQLSPRRYTMLTAEIPAKVISIQPQEGGAFKAGETLVSFDCAMQQSQLDKAKAAVTATGIMLQALSLIHI
jgi:membrane fusion protein (multidrug efflux system)